MALATQLRVQADVNAQAVVAEAEKQLKSQKRKKKKEPEDGKQASPENPFPVSVSDDVQTRIIAAGGPRIEDGKLLAVQATVKLTYNAKTGAVVDDKAKPDAQPGEADPDLRTITGIHVTRPGRQRRHYMRFADGATAVATYRQDGVYLVEIFSAAEIYGLIAHSRQNENFSPFAAM